MFGYITPRLDEVEPEEKDRFRAMYCGLCRSLGRSCGQRCRLCLSYDMTFLALLLSSLYEPAEEEDSARCPAHPVHERAYVSCECLDYAADMNVALAYYKCLDDWKDERKLRAKACAAALEKPYRAVEERNPETCAKIARCMDAIGRLERTAAARREGQAADPDLDPALDPDNPDAAANIFGLLLGEVFAWRDDFWADDLRRFGARLGKFVYMMDAMVDFEDDKKSGSYNPFVSLGTQPADMKSDLEMLADGAVESFERLPLERDLHLLRSVLYSGMWQQYNAKEAKKAEKEEKEGKKVERRG